MNVVCYKQICHKPRLLGKWSVMNVACYEHTCFEKTPLVGAYTGYCKGTNPETKHQWLLHSAIVIHKRYMMG